MPSAASGECSPARAPEGDARTATAKQMTDTLRSFFKGLLRVLTRPR
jgi:hypothetical protein